MSGVIVAFVADAAFVAGLLMVSAWQAQLRDERDVVKGEESEAGSTQLFSTARQWFSRRWGRRRDNGGYRSAERTQEHLGLRRDR